MGCETFFDKSFAGHVDLAIDPGRRSERDYIAEWSRARRADRDAQLVPRVAAGRAAAGRRACRSPTGCSRAFPKVQVPTLVIWGMKDQALLPVQLDGLDELVDDLTHRAHCPTPAISRRGRSPRRSPRRSGLSLPSAAGG